MTDSPRAVVYLAHKLSAPTREGIEVNRKSAATWAAWLSVTFKVAISADWVWLCGQLAETAKNRAWGLACDKAQVERCDELWLVGDEVTAGMMLEAQHARAHGVRVIDLTGLGKDKARINRALREQGSEVQLAA